MHKYAEEILSGLAIYRCSNAIKNQKSFMFFVTREHQVASDDMSYSEFTRAFPNFFEYYDNIDELIKDLNIPE